MSHVRKDATGRRKTSESCLASAVASPHEYLAPMFVLVTEGDVNEAVTRLLG